MKTVAAIFGKPGLQPFAVAGVIIFVTAHIVPEYHYDTNKLSFRQVSGRNPAFDLDFKPMDAG